MLNTHDSGSVLASRAAQFAALGAAICRRRKRQICVTCLRPIHPPQHGPDHL